MLTGPHSIDSPSRLSSQVTLDCIRVTVGKPTITSADYAVPFLFLLWKAVAEPAHPAYDARVLWCQAALRSQQDWTASQVGWNGTDTYMAWPQSCLFFSLKTMLQDMIFLASGTPGFHRPGQVHSGCPTMYAHSPQGLFPRTFLPQCSRKQIKPGTQSHAPNRTEGNSDIIQLQLSLDLKKKRYISHSLHPSWHPEWTTALSPS